MITKHILDIQGMQVTSMVMDENEFEELIQQLKGIIILNKEGGPDRADEAGMEAIRKAGCLPGMQRGSKTQPIFEKYEITTDFLTAIIRGRGEELAKKILEQMNRSPVTDNEDGTVDIEQDFAVLYGDAILKVLPKEAIKEIDKIHTKVYSLLEGRVTSQTWSDVAIEIYQWNKELNHLANIKALTSDTVESIKRTITNFENAKVDPEVLKNYLRRMFANNYFYMDCLKGTPSYIRTRASQEILIPVLKSAGIKYSDWVKDLENIK